MIPLSPDPIRNLEYNLEDRLRRFYAIHEVRTQVSIFMELFREFQAEQGEKASDTDYALEKHGIEE